MELPEQRVAEMAAAQDVIDSAIAAHRQLTHDETLRIEQHIARVRVIDEGLAADSNRHPIPHQAQSPTTTTTASEAASASVLPS